MIPNWEIKLRIPTNILYLSAIKSLSTLHSDYSVPISKWLRSSNNTSVHKHIPYTSLKQLPNIR